MQTPCSKSFGPFLLILKGKKEGTICADSSECKVCFDLGGWVLCRDRKRGHYARGLFVGGISRISKISKFSRTSRKWSDSPLFSTVWGISRSLESLISRNSLENGLFWKDPFSKRPLFPYLTLGGFRLHELCSYTPSMGQERHDGISSRFRGATSPETAILRGLQIRSGPWGTEHAQIPTLSHVYLIGRFLMGLV